MVQHGDDTYKYKDIRLNFSSNVYNHFDHRALFAHLSERMACVMSYPEPASQTLEAEIAAQLGVDAAEVMVTNGATEAIYMIAQAFSGARSVIPQPTFAEYAEACRMAGHTVYETSGVPEGDNGELLHWLCNPCNPTGQVMEMEGVMRMIDERTDVTFVMDHSYASFTNKPLITVHEAVRKSNVLMLHSMTKKYAIPGLRLGYITANATLLERLRRMRMPWSVNALALEAGRYLIRHDADYAINLPEMLSERRRVAEIIQQMGTIDVLPSDTHILLCRLHEGTAAELKERLACDFGILIRDASNFSGLSPQHFRIAVQTKPENDELIRCLREITTKV